VANVAVVGASGFAGALCAALVERHPRLALEVVTARSDAGRVLSDVYPRYRVDRKLEAFDADRVAEACDAALVAYPHGASGPVVEELHARGMKVVDLSADFRVPLELYERWYGPHPAPKLIGEAVYGLTELNRERIRGAQLVAAPGCYPTAALLALAPLRELAERAFVDAKSGVSGAGREATETTHFVSVAENLKPYKVEGHRHQAEIEAYFGEATFVPHLLPIDQGLLASCYVIPNREVSADEVRALFADAYADDPFVELVDQPPGVRDVRDTNLCRIHPTAVNGTVMAFAAIDNLWKGAAGQAVQDLNLMLGYDETEGLA
jgi:N-acetyl-gamma-glutamyl-phosphate reductase